MVIEKARDAGFWKRVRTEEAYRPFCEELAAMWEKECGIPVPACKYSEFIIYNQNGSRKEYEKSYFLRRRQMNVSALLALIYPDDPTYMDYLCDVLWAILDEYVWVLPAHMPSFSKTVAEHIDLFSAETGFALSEICYLLGERLPELIRSRICTEVEKRIFKAYQNNTYWWERCTNNWAAVCLCGVVGAYIYQAPEKLEELMPRIRKTAANFLSGFSKDGVCLEGFEYWHYGFGFFTCMADMLYDFTDGAVDFFEDEKVARIASRDKLSRTFSSNSQKIHKKRCQKHRMAPDTSFDRLHFSVQQVFAEIRIVWQLVDIWLPAPLDFGQFQRIGFLQCMIVARHI